VTRPKVAAVVLAAGSSTRMQGSHKLLELVGGLPMVTSAVAAALASGLEPVVVVTGHMAAEVQAVLPEGARVVHNSAHADGLASSLRTALRALPPDLDAVVVSLGDMPFVRARHFEAVVQAWRPGSIVVPVRDGRRGNPVLWSAMFIDEMCDLHGDAGAKQIMVRYPEAVIELPADDDAVLTDVDDADDLERIRQRS